MSSVYRPLVNFIATAMQTVLNLGLLCTGIILIVFLGKETLHLADVLFTPEPTSKYRLVEGLVVYFLLRVYRADRQVFSVGVPFPAALFCLYRHHRDCASDHHRP